MTETSARSTAIEGVLEFTSPVHGDDRGSFASPFREGDFRAAAGRSLFPVKDISHNVSARGVLRGIHYTAVPPGRAKYVYCPHGRVRDFLVDLRAGSPTFGRTAEAELGGGGCRALYLPIGVGHAFLALEDASVLVYVMSEGYHPDRELAVSALDPQIGLDVPEQHRVRMSPRDAAAPALAEAQARGLLPDYRQCREAEDALWK